MTLPLVRSALLRSAAWSLGAIVVAAVAGLVRVLPWVLDPEVPWRVALPFARSLLAIAVEAAVLVGWPVGAALACHAAADRGEARVLSLLGERASRTALRLVPQSLVFVALVAAASVASGLDASAPGAVATELLAQGRVACARAAAPVTYAVPLVGATWLCGPDQAPRLYGRAPGAMSGVFFSAAQARVSGDLRSIDLEDARLLFGTPEAPRQLHVRKLVLRGLAPWASASTLPPWSRALITAASGLSSALIASWSCLRRACRWPIAAIAVGAAGPLSALGTLRALERASATTSTFFVAPVVACAITLLAAAVASRLGSSRRSGAA
jgi:hypothetical protein